MAVSLLLEPRHHQGRDHQRRQKLDHRGRLLSWRPADGLPAGGERQDPLRLLYGCLRGRSAPQKRNRTEDDPVRAEPPGVPGRVYLAIGHQGRPRRL